MRVHYVGYSSKFDEWKLCDDVVTTELSAFVDEKYDFNRELAFKLKSSLVSQRRSNPLVKIEMSFDKRAFDERLKILGQLKQELTTILFVVIVI